MATNMIIVGLDVGSTKVCVIIGEINEDGVLEITGVGFCSSSGLRKSVVVNIEATLRAISAAMESAEMMSGREAHDCWTGIGGSHINGINSRGVVAISGKKRETREIGPEDISRVLEAARAVAIPMDRQILEVIPQTYIVDDQKGIRNPMDMIGVRLESEVHIITCTVTGAQNLIKCVNRAGFRVNGLIFQILAAGQAVLTQDEKDLGVVLIDLGGGTTDVLVYIDGAPYSTCTIPAGGVQVTGDISILCNISQDTAEKIKINAGCCWDDLLEDDENIIVPGIGGRPPLSIPRSQILTIIKPRMEEIFKMVKEKLDKLNLPLPLGGGVVLTGGGALLSGVVELASHVLKLPARVGSPMPVQELGGLVEEYRCPSYATAIGLVLEGAKRANMDVSKRSKDSIHDDKKNSDLIKRFKEWLKGEFF
jgi:cell division protein FtsA